jgi:hypothetical protein
MVVERTTPIELTPSWYFIMPVSGVFCARTLLHNPNSGGLGNTAVKGEKQ